MKRKLTIFLTVAVVSMVLFLFGCSPKADEVNSNGNNEQSDPVEPVNPEDISAFNEAPELKELVESGELPSVEERLPIPEDIMVEEVRDEIGVYGGDLRISWGGPDSKWAVGKPTEEPLFRFTEDGETVEPNVAKSYEVNEDATEYIIHLREGMRWSDGEPFTADDVLFYWEHMLTKETFGKSIYDAYYTIDSETGERHLAEITKINDYSFKVKHAFPSPDFLSRVAIDNKWFFAPAHFHKTILPEFVGEEKAEEIAKENGYPDIISYLVDTGYYYWINPEIPTLRPWVASNDPHSEEFVMKRNPYYWKVDAEGNQLPYINNLKASKIQDPSQALLGMLGGDFNFGAFGTGDFTVLKENEERSDYTVRLWPTTSMSSAALQLNQTVQDDKLRALFQDIRFREALSVAVDRNEVVEIVTNGIAEPIQASVPEGLFGYQEGWADKWAEFDPDRSEQLLDEIGLVEKNSDGFRLFDDGSVVTVTITEPSDANSEFIELIKDAFEKVGIKVNIKYVDEGTFQDLKYSNQLEITAEGASIVNVKLRPEVLVPVRVLTPWQGDYGLYRETDGENGTKPEGDIAKLLEYWDNLRASTTEDELSSWADEIYKLHYENQWILGYAGGTPVIVVAANNLRNVPESVIFADEFRDLGHAHLSQFFIKE